MRVLGTHWLPILLVAGLLSSCGDAPDVSPLPPLGTDITQTSTSGISSGAYMAGQFQMAHGEIVVGAAIIAGGPYGCAESAFAGLAPGLERNPLGSDHAR